MSERKKKKHSYKVGSIIAVPLPDGRFAYAKVHNDFDFGVYDFVSKEIAPVAEVLKHKIAFFQAATDEAIKSGDWPVLGEEPFPDEQSAWGPPRAVVFPPGAPLETATLKIRHKDVLGGATPAQVKGLDLDSFAQWPQLFIQILVDRLIKGNHDKYRVRP
jgi:hypothetical protein